MKVSVIMPTYNCGKYIAESIESVIAQTYTDWELEIVDDCSTDDTKEIVAAYMEKYPNIHYFCLPENGGPDVARTEAMRRATGKYHAFLDSDDLWDADKLEKQIAFMESNGYVFSCTGYRQMDDDGNSLHAALIPPEKTDYNKMLRLSDPVGNLTVIYDAEVLGKYEVPRIRKRNDFALWLKILHDADYCAGMPDVLATYRVRKSNSVSSNKFKLAKYHWHLYHDIEKLSVVKSAWAVLCWAYVKGTGKGLNKQYSDK